MATKDRTRQRHTDIRVVIYCRVSTVGQSEDGTSLDTQEAACRAYAAERGWSVMAVEREVHSGADLFERSRLSVVREMVRGRNTEVLLAYALDRLTRNQAHLGLILSECDHADTRLVFVTEELEDTPEGRLLQSVRGFVAEMERLKITERTQRGIRARVANGKPLAGWKPPYGYRWVDTEKSGLAVDPDTAATLRRIFLEIAAGKSLRSIALGLATDGIPSPTGRPRWAVSTIRAMVENPTYVGERRAFRKRCEKLKGRGWIHTLRPDSEQVLLPAGTAPALVSRDEQAAALARLARNKAESPRHNRDPEATLLRAGFARCGYCGCAMRVNHRSFGPVYQCNDPYAIRGCGRHTIAATGLDREVWGRVEVILRRPDIIAAEVERQHAAGNPADTNLAAIDTRLTGIDATRQRVARAVAALDDEEVAAPLLAELTALAHQRRHLSAERAALAAAHAAWEAEQGRLMDVNAWCQRVAGNLAAMTYDAKRDVLAAFGVQARVWRADHTPRWEITLQIDDIVSTNAELAIGGVEVGVLPLVLPRVMNTKHPSCCAGRIAIRCRWPLTDERYVSG